LSVQLLCVRVAVINCSRRIIWFPIPSKIVLSAPSSLACAQFTMSGYCEMFFCSFTMYHQNVKIRESEFPTQSEVAEYLQLLVKVYFVFIFLKSLFSSAVNDDNETFLYFFCKRRFCDSNVLFSSIVQFDKPTNWVQR